MTNTRKHQDDNIENFVRQNTRMIVKHNVEKPNSGNHHQHLYKCKDCNKEYDSFQALGGHRASHRTLKLETATSGGQSGETQPKLKLYECKVCKKGFEIGQSLGGHMRKHWKKEVKGTTENNVVVEDSCSSCSSEDSTVVSRSNGEVVFKYDLNLTPHENECANIGVGIDQDSSLDS